MFDLERIRYYQCLLLFLRIDFEDCYEIDYDEEERDREEELLFLCFLLRLLIFLHSWRITSSFYACVDEKMTMIMMNLRRMIMSLNRCFA